MKTKAEQRIEIEKWNRAADGWYQLTENGPTFFIRGPLTLADFDGDRSAWITHYIARQDDLKEFHDARRVRNTQVTITAFNTYVRKARKESRI